MRGRPSNALVPVQIPAGAYRVVAKRVEPFALMYWNGRGFTTIETFWNVYQQRWQRQRASSLSDSDLSTMSAKDRARTLRMAA